MTATARRVAAQFRSAARHSLVVRCSREGTESKEAAVSSPTNAFRLSTARIVVGRRTCEYGKGRWRDCQVSRRDAPARNELISQHWTPSSAMAARREIARVDGLL